MCIRALASVDRVARNIAERTFEVPSEGGCASMTSKSNATSPACRFLS